MFDQKIEFIEKYHQYINKETKEYYESVSRVIGQFKEKFEADKIAGFVAKKRGITKAEVLKEWEDIKNFACQRGTDIHAAMENYIKFGEVSDEYKKIIQKFDNLVKKNIENIEQIHSELLLYSDNFKVAGTSDLIWDTEGNTFVVGDFKTNKDFKYCSKYDNWLKYPLNHLSECEFNIYTLQLSVYAYLYEKLTNKKCTRIVLFWLTDSGQWEIINCNYMKHEVIMMLKAYFKNKNNDN